MNAADAEESGGVVTAEGADQQAGVVSRRVLFLCVTSFYVCVHRNAVFVLPLAMPIGVSGVRGLCVCVCLCACVCKSCLPPMCRRFPVRMLLVCMMGVISGMFPSSMRLV